MRFSASFISLVYACVVLCIPACASSMPVLGGGATTPKRRADFAFGGAARVVASGSIDASTLANPATKDAFVAWSQKQGVSPVAQGRYGVSKAFDMGLLVSGSLARVDGRYSLALADDGDTHFALLTSLAPFVGLIQTNNEDQVQGEGARYGIDVPVLFGINVGGIYELWTGLRVGAERFSGHIQAANTALPSDGSAYRVGGVLGLGVGFRHLHALIELTAGYEKLSGNINSSPLSAAGLILTPAFALRLRL